MNLRASPIFNLCAGFLYALAHLTGLFPMHEDPQSLRQLKNESELLLGGHLNGFLEDVVIIHLEATVPWGIMINFIRGTLIDKSAEAIVVDVQGVGYQIYCGARYLSLMAPEGSEVFVLTHLVHREDAMTLLGFPTIEDRDLFRLLCGVDKVGTKLAMAILGTLAPRELIEAIVSQNPHRLTEIPGVGPKLANRLVHELRDRLRGRREPLSQAVGPLGTDQAEVELALLSLGYTASEANRALGRVPKGLAVEEAIRLAIQAATEV